MKYFIAVCNPEEREDNEIGRMSEIGAYSWFKQKEREWSISRDNKVGFSHFKNVQTDDRFLFYVIAPIKKVISLFKVTSPPSEVDPDRSDWSHWVSISHIKTANNENGVSFSLLRKESQNRITRGQSFFEISQEEYIHILELL